MTQSAQQPTINGKTKMGEILAKFPGAKRALFARYHIGGCQSCRYDESETLAEVCQRNEDLPVDEVIDHIYSAHERDKEILLDPVELKAMLDNGDSLRLIDIRMNEQEFEAVKIPGAELLPHGEFPIHARLQEVYASEDKEGLIVVYDHQGRDALDAASYLIGHGFKNVRALDGGIDRYAEKADTDLPRYRIEYED